MSSIGHKIFIYLFIFNTGIPVNSESGLACSVIHQNTVLHSH